MAKLGAATAGAADWASSWARRLATPASSSSTGRARAASSSAPSEVTRQRSSCSRANAASSRPTSSSGVTREPVSISPEKPLQILIPPTAASPLTSREKTIVRLARPDRLITAFHDALKCGSFQDTVDTAPSRLQTGDSGWQAEVNTDGRASQASSVPTYTNKWVTLKTLIYMYSV